MAHKKPSPREQQILEHLWQGARPKEIAHGMGLTYATVKHYLYRMYAKYQVTGTVQLVRRALEERWISL